MLHPSRPLVVHVNAVQWTIDYLAAALDARPEPYCTGVLVATKVPNPRVPRLVAVRRDGGLPQLLVDNPRLSFRVYAETDRDADDLAQMVIGLLVRAADGSPVVSVTPESGPSDITDESKQPARYVVVSLRTVGAQQ